MTPSPATVEAFVRRFVDDYVRDNLGVMIQDAYDVAHGGCGPFAEELVAALQEAMTGIIATDRDTGDMLETDADLPQPSGFQYDFHVYVEVETSAGSLFYDALTPQGESSPAHLSFNAEQIRHARGFEPAHVDEFA